MSDPTNDINELLALFERLSRSTSGLLFERRHHALTALLAERDEARREVCELRADLRVNPTCKRQVAAERGWDCFKEDGQ
jgi:hypothetical protein